MGSDLFVEYDLCVMLKHSCVKAYPTMIWDKSNICKT
jgi:hypothetical protein